MSEVNSLLRRNILPGKEFAGLIPESNCKKVDAGTGFTDHSIDVMVEVIEEFSWQMEKVAKKLEASTLVDTVDNVFDFCHDHFQYKADKADQFLRSPACSWFDRYNGIDCKSYTILASSILTELGINHYIRKTKQPGDAPENYTHVYVIVPYDQTGSDLQKGYCVIDGTVYNNEEPPFLATNDRFMEGLQHYVLNGPVSLSGPDDVPAGTTPTTTTTTAPAGSGWISGVKSTVQSNPSFFKKLNMKTITQLFGTPISCWGWGGEATAYDEQWVNADVESMQQGLNSIITEMNAALQAENMTVFSQKVNEFIGASAIMSQCIYVKRYSQGWNKCSKDGFDTSLEVSEIFTLQAIPALHAWLNANFNSTESSQIVTYTQGYLQQKGWLPFCSWTNHQEYPVKMRNYTKKHPLPVVGFFITDYIYNLEDPSHFSTTDFFNSLKTIYGAITNPGSLFTGTIIPDPTGSNNPINPNNPVGNNGSVTTLPGNVNKPKTASMNILVGVLLVGAIVYGTMSFAPNKKSPKQ